MARIEEIFHKLKYPGAVDADGHILEAADCWEKYCEAKYKPTAIRVKADEEGYQYFEISGKASRVSRKGQPISSIGAMGEVTREKGAVNPRRKYGEDVRSGGSTRRNVFSGSISRGETPQSSTRVWD